MKKLQFALNFRLKQILSGKICWIPLFLVSRFGLFCATIYQLYYYCVIGAYIGINSNIYTIY